MGEMETFIKDNGMKAKDKARVFISTKKTADNMKETVDGLKQGLGVYTFCNGDTFEGTYENNRRHGPGFLKKTDGEHREENWKEDKLVNFNTVKEKDAK